MIFETASVVILAFWLHLGTVLISVISVISGKVYALPSTRLNISLTRVAVCSSFFCKSS